MKKKGLLLHIFITSYCIGQQAIICVPVADLLGQPLTNNTAVSYATLPECATKNSNACPRLHQALFNEVVDIVKKKDTQVCIKVYNCFYNQYNSDKKHTCYWTKQENIIPFTNFKKNTIPIQTIIPEPINFTDKTNHGLYNENIIALKKPYYDKTLQLHFSAGTRFLLSTYQSKRKNYWNIKTFNPKTMLPVTIKIPKTACIRQNSTMTHEQRITLFISILRSWSEQKKGAIAYIWGGCSFITTVTNSFTKKDSFYTYNNKNIIQSGFDCAGLILRSAQIAGLPYFYKNTTTIAKHLTDIEKNNISNGDIVWIPGHVMIIADTKKQTLIEARGYEHGYGKTQIIPLHNVFKKINTYSILQKNYLEKKPIIRIDTKKNERNLFTHYKILRLS